MLESLLRHGVRNPFPHFRAGFGGHRAAINLARVEVDFTVRGFRVKTVTTAAEKKQVLALRRSVFHYEFAKKWLSLRSDADEFDTVADHLAIFDTERGRLAGVYRLIKADGTGPCYSGSEFDLGDFLRTPSRKLELSRACIDRDYRTGVVIHLLWRGIAAYAKETGSEQLFGLSSISTTAVERIAAIHKTFVTQGLVTADELARPQPKYKIPGFEAALATAAPLTSDDEGIPSLFRTYLKAGAKLCSQPVIDRAFQCTDWLMLLDLTRLTATFERKYLRT